MVCFIVVMLFVLLCTHVIVAVPLFSILSEVGFLPSVLSVDITLVETWLDIGADFFVDDLWLTGGNS